MKNISNHTLQSINPSTYQVLGEVAISSKEEIVKKVELAHKAKKEWGEIGVAKRVILLREVVKQIEKRKDEYTMLQSREVGMPIKDGLMDFGSTIEFANWYLDHAEEHLRPETTFENEKEIHQVFHEPIGVAAIIVPWNFPLANFVWGALQSLIAGNTIVFKHSEESPLCGKFIEDMFSKSTLSKGVFNEVYGGGEVGKLLVEQDINMIAFTGSTKTGKYLYELAGKKFIKAVMELGGSAPAIVFEDADIDRVVGNVCDLRLFHAGQCCDGLKRLIVHESIYDEVVKKISAIFSSKKIGPAENKDTEIGPLVAKRQLDLLISQVSDAKEKGAIIVTGGSSLEETMHGAFFEPTVVIDVTDQMRIWNEEVFGPVLPIISFKTETEAIDLANQTTYGLGSYVYTEDTERASRVADRIESGMVGINGTNYIHPSNPFGGYKNSGFGREHGRYGFAEATQMKVVAKNK